MLQTKQDIINRLRQEILTQQGYKPAQNQTARLNGLPDIEASFPNGVFPTGMVHEFVNQKPEHAAACGGFIAGLINSLSADGGSGVCLWVSTKRFLFPVALKKFGIDPDQIIFVDVAREKEVLWVTEEALKCEGFLAVIAELQELSFTQSRRLQLAVEQSKVTGFILRNDPNKLTTTACVARWQVKPMPSQPKGGLPGIGFSRWQIDLEKVRNGTPGTWQVEWKGRTFSQMPVKPAVQSRPSFKIRKVG